MPNAVRRTFIVVLLCCTALAALAELPALIPRAALFTPAEYRLPRLSPDGMRVAYLAPDAGKAVQLWVRGVKETAAKQLTTLTDGNIHEFCWTPDGLSLYYLRDHRGDERWQACVLRLADGASAAFTPADEKVQKIVVLRAYPDDVLLELSRRRDTVLCRCHFAAGALKPDCTTYPLPPRIQEWDITADGATLAAVGALPGGGKTLGLYTPASPTTPVKVLYRWNADEQGMLLGYGEDDKALYLLSNKDADAQRLLRLEVATGETRVLAADPQYDATAILADADGVQAVEFDREKPEWTVLDPRIRDDFTALQKIDSGVFRIGPRNGATQTWMVAYYADDAPDRYYLYDRASKQATLLFAATPRLAPYTLAQSKPVTFPARDGLLLHGYLTAPAGVPLANLPMVLLVHGGPWDRDRWHFQPAVQWLANRGYLVLQVNFRGSTGYGKQLILAGNHEWGGKMQDDLSDAVAWAEAQGMVDARHIAIMGTSYGGYATLCGLAFTPDFYAAGVALCGPSDLLALRRLRGDINTPGGISENAAIGNPATEADFLTAHSPIARVGQIRAPLLIGQGANDPRIPKKQTDAFVATLRAAGKTVEYHVYPDEGHGLAREANQQDFYARVETFLARYLGGRCE